jgi:hypothetical protein
VEVFPRGADLGVAFRADAKAEGQLVRIGAWECLGGTPPHRARWYGVTLTKANAPWAFARGEPFRLIASLELFATLMSVIAFADRWPRSAKGRVQLTGITDNAGNTFTVSKMMTSKFPLVVILAELAMQLQARDMDLDLTWTPRDQNEEADAITNNEVGAFDASLEIKLDMSNLGFLVLDELMTMAERLYGEVKEARSKRKEAGVVAAKFPRRAPLRERDPW